MSHSHELEASLWALAEESRRQLGQPPTSEQLLAYDRGELAPEEVEQVREHLACDPSTLNLFLDLTAHVPDPEGPDHLSDQELAEDWEMIRSRLGPETTEAATPTAEIMPHPSSGRRWIQGSLALAAAAAFAVLGFRLLFLAQQIDELSLRLVEPQVNQTPHRLLPDGRRGGSEEPPIPIALGEDGAHLTFALYELPSFDSYRLEIYETRAPENAAPLWSKEVARETEDAFFLGFAKGFLPPGEYQFRLYGEGDAKATLLATYTVRF